MLGNLIGGFVAILVGSSLIGIVADQVAYVTHCNSTGTCDSSANGSVTGAAATILSLVTLFFAMGIMATGIAVAAQGLRAAGILGV